MCKTDNCEYCTDNKSLYWHEDEPRGNAWIREVYLELDGSMTVASQGVVMELDWRFLDYDDPREMNANFKINYCPMCGRRLEIVK